MRTFGEKHVAAEAAPHTCFALARVCPANGARTAAYVRERKSRSLRERSPRLPLVRGCKKRRLELLLGRLVEKGEPPLDGAAIVVCGRRYMQAQVGRRRVNDRC